MALTKYKIADIAINFSRKCGISNLTPNQVSGINRDKEFFEPSHQVGGDTSKYQILLTTYASPPANSGKMNLHLRSASWP